MSYGMSYMGGKSRIAEWIIDNLPPAEHFYDLFGGGGAAVTELFSILVFCSSFSILIVNILQLRVIE